MHHQRLERTVRVEILVSQDPRTVEMMIHQPLPRVPAWIMLQTHGDRPRFWTEPPGHFLERTEGRFGCPREMAATGRRYLAGGIDRAAAEAEFADALEGWSRATA
jgi:hypothetical protein